MALVGYVTLEEANDIVTQLYVSTSTEAVLWASLSDEDKQALLNRAFYRIESLPFLGAKSESGQEYQFPRDGATEVPTEVKLAEVTEALTGDKVREDNNKYAMMSARGISSYRIGNLSESFGARSASASSVFDNLTNIVAIETLQYLGTWLQGGYQICRNRY